MQCRQSNPALKIEQGRERVNMGTSANAVAGGRGGAPVPKDVDYANYFCTYAFLYHHKEMLSDRVRMDAYFNAIFENKRHFAGKVLTPLLHSLLPFHPSNLLLTFKFHKVSVVILYETTQLLAENVLHLCSVLIFLEKKWDFVLLFRVNKR